MNKENLKNLPKEIVHQPVGALKHHLISLANYEMFILVGVLMTIGVIVKLIGIFEFSSDWFWLLAGLGLMVEGTISLIKQRRFDKKYKIVERCEEEKK